ncbi:hypothetical protein P0136_05700 [Lentisphaerota bacterium ZTH]|nr:hypothetical protein JYG24_03190 [Lentisphaerota bacterium]WET07485.1 hypothetical protein P0136_05700 [Lentisphaerota bacterium ZTH]
MDQLSSVGKKKLIKAVIQEGFIIDYCPKCNMKQCYYSNILMYDDSNLKICDEIQKIITELITNNSNKLKNAMLQRKIERFNKAIDFAKQSFGDEQKITSAKK